MGYAELLHGLKTEIRTAQVRAALAANQELVLLYWRIGREILGRQDVEGWGAKVIDRLSQDLGRARPKSDAANVLTSAAIFLMLISGRAPGAKL